MNAKVKTDAEAVHEMFSNHQIQLVRGGDLLTVPAGRRFMATEKEREQLSRGARPAAVDYTAPPAQEVLGASDKPATKAPAKAAAKKPAAKQADQKPKDDDPLAGLED